MTKLVNYYNLRQVIFIFSKMAKIKKTQDKGTKQSRKNGSLKKNLGAKSDVSLVNGPVHEVEEPEEANYVMGSIQVEGIEQEESGTDKHAIASGEEDLDNETWVNPETGEEKDEFLDDEYDDPENSYYDKDDGY